MPAGGLPSGLAHAAICLLAALAGVSHAAADVQQLAAVASGGREAPAPPVDPAAELSGLPLHTAARALLLSQHPHIFPSCQRLLLALEAGADGGAELAQVRLRFVHHRTWLQASLCRAFDSAAPRRRRPFALVYSACNTSSVT
jgi:hypothetical protein